MSDLFSGRRSVEDAKGSLKAMNSAGMFREEDFPVAAGAAGPHGCEGCENNARIPKTVRCGFWERSPPRFAFPFWAVRFFRKVTAQIYVSILGGAFYEDEHRPDLTFLYERCILPFYSPPKSISVIWAVRLPNFSTVQNRILRSERCILHFYPPPRFVFSFWAVLTAFFTSSPAPSTCRNRHALTARNCGATNHTAQQSPAKSPQVASHRHVARSSESSAEPLARASHRMRR